VTTSLSTSNIVPYIKFICDKEQLIPRLKRNLKYNMKMLLKQETLKYSIMNATQATRCELCT